MEQYPKSFKSFKLTSGFTVDVEPLPPYYLDFIEDEYPIPEYPKRKIILAAGDEVFLDYTPPEAAPDVNDNEDFALYMKWQSVAENIKKLEVIRERARRDFLLSSCVTVVSGPVNIDDESWIIRLEAAFPDIVIPEHPGQKMLMFMKAVVIRSAAELNAIIQSAMFPEVTMQGITNALQSFRTEVGRKEPRRSHSRKAQS